MCVIMFISIFYYFEYFILSFPTRHSSDLGKFNPFSLFIYYIIIYTSHPIYHSYLLSFICILFSILLAIHFISILHHLIPSHSYFLCRLLLDNYIFIFDFFFFFFFLIHHLH